VLLALGLLTLSSSGCGTSDVSSERKVEGTLAATVLDTREPPSTQEQLSKQGELEGHTRAHTIVNIVVNIKKFLVNSHRNSRSLLSARTSQGGNFEWYLQMKSG
jgi:hypothetical protein